MKIQRIASDPLANTSPRMTIRRSFISSFVFVAAGVYITIVSSSPCNCRIGVSLLTGELSAVIGSHFSKGNHAPNGMKPRKQV